MGTVAAAPGSGARGLELVEVSDLGTVIGGRMGIVLPLELVEVSDLGTVLGGDSGDGGGWSL